MKRAQWLMPNANVNKYASWMLIPQRDVQDGAGTPFLHLQGDERWAMRLQLHCFNGSIPQALPVLSSGRAITAPVFDDGD
jgi:hypothetical protein